MGKKTTMNEYNDGLLEILSDHEKVMGIADRYLSLEFDDEKKEFATHLLKESCRCLKMEEAILYPTVKRSMVENGEHIEAVGVSHIHRLMSDLQHSSDVINTNHVESVDEKVKLVIKHLRELFLSEETQVMPLLRSALSDQQKTLLKETWVGASKIAPHVPTMSKGLWLVGP